MNVLSNRSTTSKAGALYATAADQPMSQIWRTIRGFILWQHERGTIQYDVMVTLILLFVFLSPYWINFHDKPAERNPHPSEVVVTADSSGGFVYQIEGSAITGPNDAAVRAQLLKIIEPIAGEVVISRYEAERDAEGRIVKYKVWLQRG